MSKSACELCNQNFNMFFNPKRICKMCTRSVCKNCGRFEEKIKSSLLLPSILERICIQCKEDMDFQKQVQVSNNTQFNKNSKLSSFWLRFLNQEQSETQYNNAKQEWVKILQNKDKDSIQEQITKDINSSKWNYSLTQWIHRNTEMQKQSDVQDIVKVTLGSFLNANPKIGYSKDMFFITFFLLTFCKNNVVYTLLHKLYHSILPRQLYPSFIMSSGIVEYQDQIIQDSLMNFQKVFKLQPTDLPSIKRFMDYNLIQMKSAMFINRINFSVCFTIFNELMENEDWGVIDKYFLMITYINIPKIQLSNQILDVNCTSLKALLDLKQRFNIQNKEIHQTPMRKHQSQRTLVVMPDMHREFQQSLNQSAKSNKISRRESMSDSRSRVQTNKSLNSDSPFDCAFSDNQIFQQQNTILEQQKSIIQLKEQIKIKEQAIKQIETDNQELYVKVENLGVDQKNQKQMLQFNLMEQSHEQLIKDLKQKINGVIQQIGTQLKI